MATDDPIGTLHLKLMGCKHLRAFNFFQKLTVYSLVSIENKQNSKSEQQKQQQQQAPTDKEGGSNLKWNHQIRFHNLDRILSNLSNSSSSSSSSSSGRNEWEYYLNIFLRFEQQHEGTVFGDKAIGEVRVPLRDRIRGCDGVVRFLSYQVKNADGKPKGILSFSCKYQSFNSNREQSINRAVEKVEEEKVEEKVKEEERVAEGRVDYLILDL